MAIPILLFQLFMAVACQFYNVESATFNITNNCRFKIWPGTLNGAGSGGGILTGFELRPKASKTLTVNPPWSGKVWARTRCSGKPGSFTCKTGDCSTGRVECNGNGGKPPATLVEFTLAGADQKDFFDISLVDGFNLPVSVKPDSRANCRSSSCSRNVNRVCPNELAVKGASGKVIGCKSACMVFGQPQYCCTGSYGSPNTCKPTNYSMIFKRQCPQAYSYAYDDKTSTFTCPTGGNYVITFCP